MTYSRRTVLAGGAGVLSLFGPSIPACGAEPQPVAHGAQGAVRGLVERGVCAFRGIPYGGAVSGRAARFRAPPPPPNWSGIRDATSYGPPAIQPFGGPGFGARSLEPEPAEDCLVLNVWTPSVDRGRRPVMFYSHGGGFTIGSGSRPGQNGANLARENDVVVVATNHRLGIFGYLYLGDLLGPEYAGNQGLLDIVAALKWVHDNIAAFGGDPHNVMIFGESGGGGKTTCLYGMPSAAPYFRKASIESPIGPRDWTRDRATEVARQALKHFELTDPRRLLDLPADQLLKFQTGEGEQPTPGRGPDHRDQLFWPIIDGDILPEVPFRDRSPVLSARKPLIVGGCKDEAVFFNFGDAAAFSLDEGGLRRRLGELFGDRADEWIQAFRRSRPQASPSQLLMAIETVAPWRAHAVHIAEQKAQEAAAPVFSYILSYESANFVPGTRYPMGAPHASDIAMKFNNVGAEPSASPGDPFADQTPARIQTAVNMSTMWATFARTGRPGAPGQPTWKPYTLAARDTMLIKDRCELASDPEGAERRFWESQPDPEAIR